MEFGEKNFFHEIDLFDFMSFFGSDFIKFFGSLCFGSYIDSLCCCLGMTILGGGGC